MHIMRAAKAKTRLHICEALSEPSLLTYTGRDVDEGPGQNLHFQTYSIAVHALIKKAYRYTHDK